MSKTVKLSSKMLKSIINEVIGASSAPSNLPEEVMSALSQLELGTGYYPVPINRRNTKTYGGDRVALVWLADFEKALVDCLNDEHPGYGEPSYEVLTAAAEAWAGANDGIYYAREKHEFDLGDAVEQAIDSGSSLVVYDNLS